MILRSASVAAIAVAATAAQAADPMSGSAPIVPSAFSANLSAYGTFGKGYPPIGDPWTITALNGEVRAGKLVGVLGMEAEAWAGGADYTFTSSVARAYYAGTGVHLNRRWDGALVGGLVSLGITPDGYNATFLNTALEAQKNFGRLTLGAQAGYTQTLSTSGGSIFSLTAPDAWYVHGIARWFPNDDLMLAGDLGYAGFKDTFGQTGNSLRWGLRLEHKLVSAPFSAFLAYQGYRWEQTSTQGTVHGVMGGISMIVGDPTLAARYRGAAGLDDRNLFYGVNGAL